MKSAFFLSIAVVLATTFGCDGSVEHFPPNRVHALVVQTNRGTVTDLAAADTAALVEAWFGTPETPRWPSELLDSGPAKDLVDPDRLARAAGEVRSDRDDRHFGLYNEHCVTCHGVSGGGDGPASTLQNPYPRDFRAGIYKWKSTERGAKPTRQNLLETLRRGVPGTGMPTFARVADDDLQALVDYVIYLSVRGEVERRLIAAAVDQLDYRDRRPDDQASLLNLVPGSADSDAGDVALATLRRVVDRWAQADGRVILVPDPPPASPESIARGKALFHGQIANCVACHGPRGAGGAGTLDFDDWTKEYTTQLSITPDDAQRLEPFRQAGAPRPRQIFPRRLDAGALRGGDDASTLYRRLIAGIAGTPMPGVLLSKQTSAVGLTSDQVWDLVHYCRFLAGKNDS